MSTPIDQVRELIHYRGLRYEARDEKRLTAALASVLADAERYKALELAMEETGYVICGIALDAVIAKAELGEAGASTLAELADKLLEQSRSNPKQ